MACVMAVCSLLAAPVVAHAASYLQCVPFARQASGIQIYGDAYTWWGQAQDAYETGQAPTTGAVLVFQPHGSMNRGHVAVVSNVLTDRVIQVTHANWSRINGRRGQIEENVTVVDVSASGDWSSVKVWYDPIGDLGSTEYPIYGFIYQDDEALELAEIPGAPVFETAVLETEPQVVESALVAEDQLAVLIQAAARITE